MIQQKPLIKHKEKIDVVNTESKLLQDKVKSLYILIHQGFAYFLYNDAIVIMEMLRPKYIFMPKKLTEYNILFQHEASFFAFEDAGKK